MRKQELIHLHGLLVEVTESLVDQGTAPTEVWTEYEALEVTAHSIQASKRDHEEAVVFLATTLATLERVTEEQPVSIGNE